MARFTTALEENDSIEDVYGKRGVRRMKLKDLIAYAMDDVCVYVETNKDEDSVEYKDLYKGNPRNVPKDLLQREVRLFGAKKKGLVDIELES